MMNPSLPLLVIIFGLVVFASSTRMQVILLRERVAKIERRLRGESCD